jgi:hypothetical protein
MTLKKSKWKLKTFLCVWLLSSLGCIAYQTHLQEAAGHSVSISTIVSQYIPGVTLSGLLIAVIISGPVLFIGDFILLMRTLINKKGEKP